MDRVKRVVVTGGAGQIAYSLLFRIASGELLGKDKKISLYILEVEAAIESLRGVVMELEDCAFPLLQEVRFGSDPMEVFEGADYVFLIGAKPRGPGMERKDLLADNGHIFVRQGQALDQVANKDVLTLVVGNPCNTNCLIAGSFARRICRERFFAMTRLDQNRAVSFLAKRAKVSVSEVSDLVIWGNHSATQVPDTLHAKIRGKKAQDVLQEDLLWLQGEFFAQVQQRGAQVIAARGKSSAASAANAALDAMRSLIFPTDQVFSMGISAENNPYGIDPDLIFSFPCKSLGDGVVKIVPDFLWDDFLKQKILASERELLEERKLVEFLRGKG